MALLGWGKKYNRQWPCLVEERNTTGKGIKSYTKCIESPGVLIVS